MEPIVVYRLAPGRVPPEGARLFATAGPGTEGVFLFRADFDALVKERDEERRIADHYREACKIAGHDPLLDRFVDAVDSLWACIRAFEKPDDAYPEDTVSRLGYEARCATARADKAEALLREARGWLAALLKIGADKPAVDALVARIDAHLAAKGQTAPTPADPKNPAPKATSAAGCTEQKEP